MANLSAEETKKIFATLKSKPHNKICFDCSAKNPTWRFVCVCLSLPAV